MPNKFTCNSLRTHFQPYPVVTRRLLLTAALIIFFNADPAWAGECLMSDEDMYKDVVSFAEAAKKGGMGSLYHGGDLYCWRGDQGLDAKLRAVLTDMLFDSRIHAAHVALALNDYQSVFGVPKALLDEVKKKQGPSRYALISAIRERTGAAVPPAAVSRSDEKFSEDVDFIDGPANIRKEPKGTLVASLPDNAKVRIQRKQDNWVEIVSEGVRGWTARTNLMGSHVGAVDADGFYVLSRAAFMGYSETVRFLLSRGAQADLVDGFGRNALHWAVRGGFAGLGESELEMVKLLSTIPGVNVNCVDKEGMTPLLTAITLGRRDMATVLLGMGTIDVNLPGREGVTPLMRAIQYHRSDIFGALLNARGLNMDAADERGRTALYHAVALGDQASVRLLLERKTRTDTVTKEGKTLLHALFVPLPWRLTADPANIEIVKLLTARKDIDINKADENGNTAMSLAIEQDSPAIVKLFLSRPDLDVNKPTQDGGRYLHRVIGLSNLQHGYEMAMMLLDREEIDVNAPIYRGVTVVHMGWYNSGMGTHGLELAKKILARRPNLNREDEYGETPLVYNINQNRPEMVRLLAGAKGIDLNRVIRSDNLTPIAHARLRKYDEIVEILRNAGAHEFPQVGGAERTPEGIPQSLLQNWPAAESIILLRGYLIDETAKTLQAVREQRLDDAVRKQEAVLDLFVAEQEDWIPQYSSHQRDLAKKVLAEIKQHYQRHPRNKSGWFKDIPENQKAYYASIDALRNEILAGKYDTAPDGEFAQRPSVEPAIILRDYMVKGSIKVLSLLKAGKTAAAEEFLKDIISHSDPTGFYKK